MQWAYEKILELPSAAEAQFFFREGCPDNRLTLQPHQQAQGRLTTGVGGVGLPLTEATRMSASIGRRVRILPAILADLTGPIGDRVGRGLPESAIINSSEVACDRFKTYGGSREKRWQTSFSNLGWNGAWA